MDEFEISKSTSDWIESTAARRAALRSWAHSGGDLNTTTALTKEDDAARLLSEAEGHLIFERSRAMWFAKKSYPDLTSRERDLIEKAAVRDIQLVVNDCQITRESCKSRYFIIKG